MGRLNHAPAVLAVALAASLLAAGCAKKTAEPKPALDQRAGAPGRGGRGGGYTGTDPVQLFAGNCQRCHGALDGTAKGRAPSLVHAGAKEERTVDWLVAQLENPQQHEADSRMPKFKGRLTDEQIRSLAEHLASLK